MKRRRIARRILALGIGAFTSLTAETGCTLYRHEPLGPNQQIAVPIVKPCSGEPERGYIREGKWQYKERVHLSNDVLHKVKSLEEARKLGSPFPWSPLFLQFIFRFFKYNQYN